MTKKGGNTMSKRGSITYQIQRELQSKCRFGESRHEAKIRGEANKYIYSYATLQTYQKQLCYMVKWAKTNSVKRKSIEDIKLNGDKWLQDCVNQGMSAWTVTTRRAALGKLCGVGYSYFKTPMPIRKRADIKRGRNPDLKRGFSEKLNFEQVTFCRCTGVRLHELKALTGNDLIEKESGFYIHVKKGKGGKERYAKLYGSKDEIALCIELARKAGVDVIILDHHEPVRDGKEVILPEANVICDPHVTGGDKIYNFDDLCGAGIALHFCLKLIEIFNNIVLF